MPGGTPVLARRGLEVSGIDPSPGAVAVARARGVPARLASILDPPYEPAHTGFDTVLLLGNNLGLLTSRSEAPTVLAALARLAAPGARLLGTVLDPYLTAVPEHLAYHELNRSRGRMPGQVRMRVRHGLLATDWFDYLFLSPQELGHLVSGSPWSVAEITRDGTGYLAELTLGGARA